ncbi:MAG: hypothetical protein EAZ85_11800 [Bacteroidetes bacterium]|nr:MAG: hypothetical protein EAZ85_11800 [Bacteroidota bacterium]TAG92025.1 MAG: hypothetical protein EAZ20_02890 [Bacteroidota bacterium]
MKKNIIVVLSLFFLIFGHLLAQKNNCIDAKTQKIIKSITKGCRPEPSVYLSQKCIDKHLKKFSEGASFFIPKDVLDRFGRKILGRNDGQFVIPTKEMNRLIKKSKGSLTYIETELGIPAGAWKDKIIIRIDILELSELNIRLPNGNEAGANELWIPGGKLPKGYSEAVVNPIPEGKYRETIVDLK